MGGLSRQGSLIARGPRYSLYLERGHRLVQPTSRTHSPPRYHRRARGLSLDPPCPQRGRCCCSLAWYRSSHSWSGRQCCIVSAANLSLPGVNPTSPNTSLPRALRRNLLQTQEAVLLQAEAARRRTFAIVSHPDAGKTTLTEKLLLYGGAIDTAGLVKARRGDRTTRSDWMDIEQQRGISISSTVLRFNHRSCVLNLLDTPGHRDFSEDTYRVLTAVDAAVMVLDAAKLVEERTLRLFEVCRSRGTPLITFVNKCDRPAGPPLGILDEIEDKLAVQATPVTWPVALVDKGYE